MLVVEQKKPDNDQKNPPATYFQNRVPAWLCNEAKFTDLLLAYFTYCLVILGWFGIRDTEQNREALERAYIFPGYELIFDLSGRPKIKLFMENSGRMPGVVKRVEYAFLDHTALPSSREDADVPWTKQTWDWVGPTRVRKLIGEFESPYEGDQTFVAYIVYQDLFTKREHASWMGMYMYPSRSENEQTARGGGDAWNDWD